MNSRPSYQLPDITEPDGNVFSIIARVSRLLKKAGLKQEAEEFCSRAMNSEDYQDVLAIIGEYVEIE